MGAEAGQSALRDAGFKVPRFETVTDSMAGPFESDDPRLAALEAAEAWNPIRSRSSRSPAGDARARLSWWAVAASLIGAIGSPSRP